MTRLPTFCAALALLAAAPLGAQLAPRADLPPIPAVNAYSHWGQIDRSFDDDEGATSVSLSLPLEDKHLGDFLRRGLASRAELSAGYVFSGRQMTAYPEIVTVLLKFDRPAEAALHTDRQGTNDVTINLAGSKPLVVPAPLVSRSGTDIVGGRPRNVEDTYVIVLTLGQFLRVVNSPTVSAQLHDMRLDLTGGPLEGLKDLASRIGAAQ